MIINLTINGDTRNYHGDPRSSLLEVLRKHFHLTGAKAVCNEGFCGACTVHVNGSPIMSCLQPIGVLDGADVTTIEGIASMDELNIVQQAFEDFDVVQCGMCFPGMVMSLSAFLKKNPNPSRDEIKFAMTGNICRCTGYERIIDALMSLQSLEQTPSQKNVEVAP
ncbi:MAG: (2Fe-2S)-binding protein [Sneathiella sp.]|uniref:(2Fe-2S)-binding protein n=1 Tax=Sneathiella sp. TaxID=1964365 RepID=UPI003001375A